MEWLEIKAKLLGAGGVRVSGDPIETIGGYSKAGPGAGLPPPLFFSPYGIEERRVKLPINEESRYVLNYKKGGKAAIEIDGTTIVGTIEPAPLHCPRQAFIAVTESCIYDCCFCGIAKKSGIRKSPEKIKSLIEANRDTIEAISLTSGVLTNPEEEEKYILNIVDMLREYNLPIGVSILPVDGTSERLAEHGVAEVKYNLETATDELFKKLCPGLDRDVIFRELERSVDLFGINRVYSNIIVGLGETDEDIKIITERLASSGIIPILRPLSPAGTLSTYERPSEQRLIGLAKMQKAVLDKAELDGSQALTMCAACTGCDLATWRDI